MKKKAPAAKKRHPVRNSILIVLALFIVGYAGYSLVSGYVATLPKLTYAYGTAVEPAKYPACKFAVISDVHYYDTSLGDTGSAFEAYLANDRKLLTESGDILDAAVNNMLASGVQFVLVNGDMTKDGEKQCHEHVAAELKKLTDKGIKVYVVPGNHDVNNPLSESYSGEKTSPVPNVSKEEFAQIYAGFGYGDAIERDAGSLSYVAEPAPGLWLVCMDSCEYYLNKPGVEETVPGKFTQAEETWLEGVLKKAEDSGRAVMLMMHHGLVEHWPGQKKLYPEYLVKDYPHVGQLLASYNVRLAFTGHYHAQDVADSRFSSRGFLYDVETGSLVTDPCPVRYCEIDAAQNFNYHTVRLADTMYPGKSFDQYPSFEKYAAESLKKSISDIAFHTLRGYLVNERDSRAIADCVSAGFVAHYAGDEDASKAPALDKSKLTLWSRIILSQEQYVIDGQWHDPSVKADNNGSLSLSGN